MKRCAAFVLAMLVLTGCSAKKTESEDYIIDISSIGIPDPEEETTEPPFRATSVRFAAVGDNLIHSRVYQTAQAHNDSNKTEYDFHYCYENIADSIAEADLAFVNQESLICGEGYEVTGTKLNFNSPVELGDNLIDIGFDVFNIGNNHMLDKGTDGLAACMTYWQEQCKENEKIAVIGCYENEEDMQNYRILRSKGLNIGFLSYTQHTNGYQLPEDSDLQIVYTDNEELIQQQIQELSEQTDCVIVSAHWGEEDTYEVTESVKELAQKMIDWGADVIIGTGSHTLQTMEYLTRADGSQGFVFYSLGNLISAQTDNFNMVGGLGNFEICRDTEGVITVENVTLTPLITHYDSGMENVRVYPYDAYTDALIEKHNIPYASGGTAKNWDREVIETIISENVPAQFRQTARQDTAETEPESRDETDSETDSESE